MRGSTQSGSWAKRASAAGTTRAPPRIARRRGRRAAGSRTSVKGVGAYSRMLPPVETSPARRPGWRPGVLGRTSPIERLFCWGSVAGGATATIRRLVGRYPLRETPAAALRPHLAPSTPPSGRLDTVRRRSYGALDAIRRSGQPARPRSARRAAHRLRSDGRRPWWVDHPCRPCAWAGHAWAGHAAAGPAAAGLAGAGRAPRLGIAGLDRRTLTLVGAALLAAWLVLVFGRAISQSNEVAAQAAMLRTQDAALSQQVADRQAELSVIQSPAFLALEARAYGYGKSSEQVFALQPGAPAPPSITPLGAEPSPAPPPAPLDAWLQLLVGRSSHGTAWRPE